MFYLNKLLLVGSSPAVSFIQFPSGTGGARDSIYGFPKGRFSRMDRRFVSSTNTALPSERLRLRDFFVRMCRLPCLRRKILPVPVTLNRLATDLRVLALPDVLAMGRRRLGISNGRSSRFSHLRTFFLNTLCHRGLFDF